MSVESEDFEVDTCPMPPKYRRKAPFFRINAPLEPPSEGPPGEDCIIIIKENDDIWKQVLAKKKYTVFRRSRVFHAAHL